MSDSQLALQAALDRHCDQQQQQQQQQQASGAEPAQPGPTGYVQRPKSKLRSPSLLDLSLHGVPFTLQVHRLPLTQGCVNG